LSLPRLLIDENLSVALPPVAHTRGFECAHVAHQGFHTWKDWSLMDEVASSDWVLVTNNAVEFRGRYKQIDLHPGVVFIVPNVRRPQQIELFEGALSDIEADPDLINAALDVTYDGGDIVVHRYPLP
jgi:predicted nuclease of predicted toxin-antitoxin system